MYDFEFTIFIIFILSITFYLIRRFQVSKYIIRKYGKPLKLFEVGRAWNKLIVNNSPTVVAFYDEFLVIKYLWTGKEYVVSRTQNVKGFYDYLYFIIEIPIETKSSYEKIQLSCFKGRKEQYFLDYFK